MRRPKPVASGEPPTLSKEAPRARGDGSYGGRSGARPTEQLEHEPHEVHGIDWFRHQNGEPGAYVLGEIVAGEKGVELW